MEFTNNPEATDFHGTKRELLKLGREQGFLEWTEIHKVMPSTVLREGELEVFIFTCENLGIELRD